MGSDEISKSFGFIGVGNMGYPMAMNLAQKVPSPKTIYIYDVNHEILERMAKEVDCMTVCKSAREVGEKADIIFTMVNEGSHVRSVYLTPETGVFAASNLKGKYFFDCSTIDFATSLLIGKELKKREPEATFYDAPVSGGVLGATAGTLAIMVGCAESNPDWPLIKKVFQYMASEERIMPAGGLGLGITAKLCNNYIAATIALSTTEAFNWGMKAGMDPRFLHRIVIESTASSRHALRDLAVPGVCPDSAASKGYQPGYKTELAIKDARLAQESAEKAGAKMVLVEKVVECFTSIAHEYPDKDFRIMYKWLGGDVDWEAHLPEQN